MNKISSSLGLSALLVALLLPGAPAAAADAKDNSGQLRGLQQRLRAAEQDRSKLAQDKSELDGQVKDVAEKLNQTRRSADLANRQKAVLGKALETATADKAALIQQLAEAEKKFAALQARLNEADAGLATVAGSLQRSELSMRQLGETLAQDKQTLAECSAKNESLYQVGGLLLAQFESGSAGSPLDSEPFTKMSRVALENRVEDYREQLEQQQFGLQQQARHDLAVRQKGLRQLEQERLVREQAEQGKTDREQNQLAKVKQQTELDKMTREVRSFFDNLKW